MRTCARCGYELDLEIVKSSFCPSCRADLKTCTNCVFYSPGVHWDCRESIPEPVREKDKANFCDYFRFKEAGPHKENGNTGKKAKQDFFKLFGTE